MRDQAVRAIAECRRIAAMSEEPGRTTRRFLTPPMRDVHALLRRRMETMGMTVSIDEAGNLHGLWRPANARGKRLMMGSHVDTVPDAGAFDGVLGVTLALEWAEVARNLELPLAIEVIAFSDEEGVRYGVPFLGSRAVAGCFDLDLFSREDADGVRMDDAMRAFELDPAKIGEAALGDDVLGYVELHIEQGPVLETENLSVAAVSAITGQTRINLSFSGQANHAGTTPMHLRRDALAAAAEWIIAVEALAQRTDGLVATVGKISVEPNASNVVPGGAKFSLDVRHASDGQRASSVERLLAEARAITGRRGIGFEYAIQMDQPAVPMDGHLTSLLTEAIEAAELHLKIMPSGAGHDAMVMASRVPAAMLFLRSPGGISHHPAENVLEADVEDALRVGREFLRRIAKEIDIG